jgi:hypothetical protein
VKDRRKTKTKKNIVDPLPENEEEEEETQKE